MDALILAAGIGSRLGSIANGLKFGVRIAGRPLIQYPAMSLVAAGASRLVVVTRPGLGGLVERLLRDVPAELRVVENGEWWRENGYSMYLGGRHARAPFLMSMSDHIYPPEIPLRLLRARGELGAGLVAGDRSPRLVDVSEATLIYAPQGLVREVGKGLGRWTHVDTGVFLIDAPALEAAGRLSRLRRRFGVSDVVRMSGGFAVVDVTGVPWMEVDTPSDYRRAAYGAGRILAEYVERRWVKWLSARGLTARSQGT